MNFEIDHLGIAVESLAGGLAFYQQTLGMQVDHCESVESERVNVAMLPTGTGPGRANIELLEATDDASSVARFLKQRGPGLHHVALRVDDLMATAERLKESGCQLLNAPRRGAGGHLYVFVHPRSTGGVLLELIQQENISHIGAR